MTFTRPAPFLTRLLKMAESGDVLLDSNGNLSFANTQVFASEVLPRYFNHSNVSSFERQLYNYSWRKIVKGPKLAEPRVFHNQTLKGQDPAMIMTLPRKAIVANNSDGNGSGNHAENETSTSLSKYNGITPADINAALSKTAPQGCARTAGSAGGRSRSTGSGKSTRVSSVAAAACEVDVGVDANGRKRSRALARASEAGSTNDGPVWRKRWRAVESPLSTAIAGAGSAGGGDGGGYRGGRGAQRNSTEGRRFPSKGVTLVVTPGKVDVGGNRSGGGTVCHRTLTTFCGWQSPRRNTKGELRADGEGCRDGRSSAGGCAADGSYREGGELRQAPTGRKLDVGVGVGGEGAGGGDDRDSSINSLLTVVQIQINDRPRRRGGGARLARPDSGGGAVPEPSRESRASSTAHLGYQGRLPVAGCPVDVDHPTLPTPVLQDFAVPAAAGFAAPQASEPAPASGAHDDGTSRELFLTSRNASRFLSPKQPRLVSVGVAGTPTRSRPSPSFRSNRRDDAGFEGKSFGDSLLCSGGFEAMQTPSEDGPATASDDMSSFLSDRGGHAGGSGGDCARRGVLLSPARVLPLTPSPLALDRPGDRLLGLW